MALDDEAGSGIRLAFTTPILVCMLPDAETVNASLGQCILEAEAADKPAQGSSVGGWHCADLSAVAFASDRNAETMGPRRRCMAFPGWLEHFAHPFFGEAERISSIAINVTVRKVGEIELH